MLDVEPVQLTLRNRLPDLRGLRFVGQRPEDKPADSETCMACSVVVGMREWLIAVPLARARRRTPGTRRVLRDASGGQREGEQCREQRER